MLPVLLAATLAVHAAPPDDTPTAARHLCDVAGLSRSAEGLLAWLRIRTPGDLFAKEVERLVTTLGADEFAARRAAFDRLVGYGTAALPVLQRHESSADAEVRQRVRDLLRRVENKAAAEARVKAPLSRAVVKCLARTPHPDAAAVLLSYLPHADAEETREEVYATLDELREFGSGAKAMAAALTDAHSARRAAAGCVLARSADSTRAKALLRDADPHVRLRVAQGLLSRRVPDRDALPALAALIDAETSIALQADELLRYAAGDGAPKAYPDRPADRRKCADAWKAWVAANADLDLRGLHKSGRRPGLVVVERTYRGDDFKSTRRVRLYGGDGEGRAFDGKVSWCDVQLERGEEIADAGEHPELGDLGRYSFVPAPDGRLYGMQSDRLPVTRDERDGDAAWRPDPKARTPVAVRGTGAASAFRLPGEAADRLRFLPTGEAFALLLVAGKFATLTEVTADGRAIRTFDHLAAQEMPYFPVVAAARLWNGDTLVVADRPVEFDSDGRARFDLPPESDLATRGRIIHRAAVVYPLVRFGFRRESAPAVAAATGNAAWTAALADPRPATRAWAVGKLAAWYTERRVDPDAATRSAVLALVRDADKGVAAAAANFFCYPTRYRWVTRETVPALVEAVNRHAVGGDALGWADGDVVIPLLRPLAAGGPRAKAAVRAQAVKALAYLAVVQEHAAAVEAMREVFRDADPAVVKAALAEVNWAMFMKPQSRKPSRPPYGHPHLKSWGPEILRMADSDDREIVSQAENLGWNARYAGAVLVPRLLKRLDDPKRRMKAIGALTMAGMVDAEAQRVLIDLIDAKNPADEVAAAMRASGQVDRKRLVEKLAAALADARPCKDGEKTTVRGCAAWALSRHGDDARAAIPALRRMLTTPGVTDEEQGTAVSTLLTLGDTKVALEAVALFRARPETDIGSSIISALQGVTDPAVVAELVKAARARRPWVPTSLALDEVSMTYTVPRSSEPSATVWERVRIISEKTRTLPPAVRDVIADRKADLADRAAALAVAAAAKTPEALKVVTAVARDAKEDVHARHAAIEALLAWRAEAANVLAEMSADKGLPVTVRAAVEKVLAAAKTPRREVPSEDAHLLGR